MERIGYTRLYATLTGAALVLLGLAGLLENAEFQYPRLSSELLGVYAVNGWANVFHVVIGLVALLMARSLSRVYAVIAAIIFLGLGIWGVAATDGTLLLSKLPAARNVNLLNLLLGGAALACLIAVDWNRIRSRVADRIRKRRTRTTRRERRKRERRQRAKAKRSEPARQKGGQRTEKKPKKTKKDPASGSKPKSEDESKAGKPKEPKGRDSETGS